VRGGSPERDVYIEYLGMSTPEYNERWEHKLRAYHEFGITEPGGPMGRLIVLDARPILPRQLDDIQMLDRLEVVFGIGGNGNQTIEEGAAS
jgi:hypothetical protein